MIHRPAIASVLSKVRNIRAATPPGALGPGQELLAAGELLGKALQNGACFESEGAHSPALRPLRACLSSSLDRTGRRTKKVYLIRRDIVIWSIRLLLIIKSISIVPLCIWCLSLFALVALLVALLVCTSLTSPTNIFSSLFALVSSLGPRLCAAFKWAPSTGYPPHNPYLVETLAAGSRSECVHLRNRQVPSRALVSLLRKKFAY